MQIVGTTDQHGTKVTFKPDPEMFDTTEYDYETLHTRMREQAFLNAGLHITISDERIESADKPEKAVSYTHLIRTILHLLRAAAT